MSDLIRREDAYAAIRGLTRHIDRIAAITALPAVQPDAREAALRDLADDLDALADDLCHFSEATRFNMHTRVAGIRNALSATKGGDA